MKPQAIGQRWTWLCHDCEHPVSAMSTQGIEQAMEDHARYVKATRDPETDPHFEAFRCDRLIDA